MFTVSRHRFFVVILGASFSFGLGTAWAHCDTYDGPVVKDAQMALDSGKVDLVLKWVGRPDEAAIRTAFQETQAVRKLGPAAKQLADQYFFETLVRIHRAGEGAPYTGLKPAGKIDPAVGMADKALETGSAANLGKAIGEHFQKTLNEKFRATYNAKKHAGQNVEAGRAYVHAYVDYVHYVEGVHNAIAGAPSHGEPAQIESERHTH